MFLLLFSYSRLFSHTEDSQLWGGPRSGQDKREDATAQRWPAARWYSDQRKYPRQERHWWISSSGTVLASSLNPYHLTPSIPLCPLHLSHPPSLYVLSVPSAETARPSFVSHYGQRTEADASVDQNKVATLLGKHFPAARKEKKNKNKETN